MHKSLFWHYNTQKSHIITCLCLKYLVSIAYKLKKPTRLEVGDANWKSGQVEIFSQGAPNSTVSRSAPHILMGKHKETPDFDSLGRPREYQSQLSCIAIIPHYHKPKYKVKCTKMTWDKSWREFSVLLFL